jgi:DNA-binding winged helix-turn-helix (wHTH) protein
VQTRLIASLGRPSFELKDLGPPETLLLWLHRCGNASPRGWLEAVRPFLDRYLSLAEQRPLTIDECHQVAWDHPPPLRIDPETDEVTVGWRRVEDLGVGHLALLRHLLGHAGQLCSRKQLYRIYVEAYPQSKADPDARPAEYANLLDNALDRLREKIEPLPDAPVLLETKKGKGVRLRSLL